MTSRSGPPIKPRIPALNDLLSGATSEDFQRLRAPLTRKPKGRQHRSTVPTTPAIALPGDYTHWLADIKARVVTARHRAVLAANAEMIQLYWQVGREILSRQAQQDGETEVIDKLARDLHVAFPSIRGFSPRNLQYMRNFAEAWPDTEIWQQFVARLPWGHNVLLLTMLKDPAERLHYAEEAVANGWSRSTLEANIRDKQGKR
jgi:predicted nuclease of restriction endonuclease-like (RecB) superfamily